MTAETIALAAVTKRYGAETAVRGVALSLLAGQCVGLVGHNGAGKSTLIKLMLGLIRPTAGRVVVLGEDPAAGAAARARREVGYLPENVSLYPAMTGRETLAFYARLKRQSPAGNDALLERVGLAKASRRRVGTYSKGMRQRLGLAQALLGAPKVLLLDEPTTGLDPALRQSFYDVVRELRDGGATVLLSSHALAEMEGQVDRVVIMNRGAKVADGTLLELRHLADRPVRIRLTLPDDRLEQVPRVVGPAAGWRRVGSGVVELTCRDTEKVAALQAVAGLAMPLHDIEVLSPSLDEIYADFLRREAAQ